MTFRYLVKAIIFVSLGYLAGGLLMTGVEELRSDPYTATRPVPMVSEPLDGEAWFYPDAPLDASQVSDRRGTDRFCVKMIVCINWEVK